MTIVLAGSARLRQIFFVYGVASRAVSVRFCSGTVRSDWSTFLALATMTAEAPKQLCVVAISKGGVALERDQQVVVDCEDSLGSRHLQH
jgi:hypothetical protein